jgi:acetyl/propionyl-CoA carboxylase alpha subunit
MKTAQKMGIKHVVYSVDRNAPHVKFADEAV